MTRYLTRASLAPLTEIERTWRGMGGAHDTPRRADLDPRQMEEALPHAFILERVAPQVARVRVAGAHLNALMGMEVRGMPLTALFAAPARADLGTLIEEVCRDGIKGEADLTSAAGYGRPALNGALLLLPLRGDGDVVNQVLGGIVMVGEIGSAPRRLGIAATRLSTASRAPSLAPQGAFAEAAEPFVPKQKPKQMRAERPYLRLVKSSD